jgi:CheY-like chemotaxis protein
MTAPAHRVGLLGFGAFERSTLASCFRLEGPREPAYMLAELPSEADWLVVDADHASAVHLVLAAERLDDTVFIGSHAPPGATAWMPRPIDPVHLMRELDALVAQRAVTVPAALPPVPQPAPAAARRSTAKPGPSAAAAAPASPSLRRAGGAAGAVALLVDDSEVALHFLARKLQRWGLACLLASDSTYALQLLAARPFDFVFIDVELGPGSALDGLTLCQQIRRRHPPHDAGAPLLALVSAHASELDRVRGTFAGADAYLGKPLDDAELSRLLRAHGLRERAAAPAAASGAGG